jgi:hypothetical protein
MNQEAIAMQTTRLSFLAIVIILVVATSVSANQAINANEVLLSAMSPFEDMIEFALAESHSDVSKALAAADQQAPGVKTVLPALAASQFDTLMARLHRAATEKDHHKTASSAVEIFRLLIDNLQAKDLKEPKEVSLLDYAGFKLRVLAAARNPDWKDIRRTVGEAAGWWNTIGSKVSQKGLRDAFDTSIRGLDDAAKLENLPMLRFAAQLELQLVDLLEDDLRPKQ